MSTKWIRFVLSATLAALSAVSAAQAAGPYQIIGTAASRTANLVRTETTVQAGVNPLDRFKMIRLAKDVPAAQLKGSVLFLPPLGTTFSFYEQRDESGGIGTSIAEFFALRNIDVYGYSPRFEGLPAGGCEAGVLDCSVMANWDIQSMVDDIAFVRSRIEALHPGTRIAVGGASLGAILSIAVVNAAPGDYDGAIPWEGMLFTPDPAVQALNQGYCAALQAQFAGGIFYDGFGINLFRLVAQYADLAPSGLTPIPLFPPLFSNHQVLVLTLSVPTPGPVSMPVPGYIQMQGSLADDRLEFASEPRVYEGIGRFSNYTPTALVADISCALAGLDDQHVDNLGSFTGPVLAISSGHGFGPYMQGQLSLFGSSDVKQLLEPGFGHIDAFMTPRHREFVERPILQWLQKLF